jgi:hypothetical protein
MEMIFTLTAAVALLMAGVAFLPQPQKRALRVRVRDARR